MDNVNKKEKVAVYIDGSNFYGYLKDAEINCPKGTKFDFKKFVDFLAGDTRELVSKRYHTGVFRNLDGSEKAKILCADNKSFLPISKMTDL